MMTTPLETLASHVIKISFDLNKLEDEEKQPSSKKKTKTYC
jgi:hypothetical protein